MNLLILISIILSVILGLLRGLDLAFFTDAATRLCLTGSVWLRYFLLGGAVLLAILAGRTIRRTEGIREQSRAAGIAAAGAAVFFLLAGVARLLFALEGVGTVVRALLELFCCVWMSLLARNWLRSGPWHRPTRSLYPAVAGSLLFYWCVLTCFMKNSSSWYRVAPTTEVWQMLVAVVFLVSLARALYLPEKANGKLLGAAGMASFTLCLCWELPQTVSLLSGGFRMTRLPELLFGLGVCCVGAMGGITALRCKEGTGAAAQTDTRESGRHSVG